MQITINGELRDVDPDTTLLNLMKSLGLKPELTAVQRNDEIIDKKEHSDTILLEGDHVELIRVVGGG